MVKHMTPGFIQQFTIHTICSVTGASPKAIIALDRIELTARDWEQVFSRLEAAFDIQIDMLTSTNRSLSIESLMHAIQIKMVT